MSYLLQEDYVQYECSCRSQVPISRLYFCRHCCQLRCEYCVRHEVDSHYCSNCMELLPHSEARMKKNRCANCFDCPNCSHTLSVRATTKAPLSSASKASSKKYYLACFFCRWTTRDAGIPDQTSMSGNWPVKENPHQGLFDAYVEYYKTVVVKEKTLKEKKFSLYRRYPSYSDKFGVTNMIARKRAGLPPLPCLGKDLSSMNLFSIPQHVASDQVKPLSDSYFTDAPDLTKISTIPQRHANPALQAESWSDYYPQGRHFYSKRSLRCRRCEHNVSKPEYNPGSVKFKILQTAFNLMPEVRILSYERLLAGQPSEIILNISNPTGHVMLLTFRHQPNDVEPPPEYSLTQGSSMKALEIPSPALHDAPNTKADLPSSSVALLPKDDTTEYDDPEDTNEEVAKGCDDVKSVIRGTAHRAAVKFVISPDRKLLPGTKVVFSFCLEYNSETSFAAVDRKPPHSTTICVKVTITPGVIMSKED